MVNDVLEQIVEDFFRSKGYFTQHNVKYRPLEKSPKYSVHSDVDFIGVHPLLKGPGRVVVANCKSWQGGLKVGDFLSDFRMNRDKKRANKESWKHFREVADPIWAAALKMKVKEITGSEEFTFFTVVTAFRGDKKEWEDCDLFKKNLPRCSIQLMSLKDMLLELQEKVNITPAHSELSRMLQLIKAGRGRVIYQD